MTNQYNPEEIAAGPIQFVPTPMMSLPESLTQKLIENLLQQIEDFRYALEQARKQTVKLLDEKHGTPCEQIRHQQKVEELEDKIQELIKENNDLRLRPPMIIKDEGDILAVLGGKDKLIESLNKQIRTLENQCDQNAAFAQQEHDIRETREATLQAIAKIIGLEDEPHQTYFERMLERVEILCDIEIFINTENPHFEPIAERETFQTWRKNK